MMIVVVELVPVVSASSQDAVNEVAKLHAKLSTRVIEKVKRPPSKPFASAVKLVTISVALIHVLYSFL